MGVNGAGAARLKEIASSSSSMTFIETDMVRSSTASSYFSSAPPSGVILRYKPSSKARTTWGIIGEFA